MDGWVGGSWAEPHHLCASPPLFPRGFDGVLDGNVEGLEQRSFLEIIAAAVLHTKIPQLMFVYIDSDTWYCCTFQYASLYLRMRLLYLLLKTHKNFFLKTSSWAGTQSRHFIRLSSIGYISLSSPSKILGSWCSLTLWRPHISAISKLKSCGKKSQQLFRNFITLFLQLQ